MSKNYLFCKVLLPVVALLLCAGSTPPLFAQRTVQQYLNQNIHILTVGGNSVVTIQEGDTNMVSIVSNKAIEHVMKVADGSIDVKDGSHTIILTLKQPQSFSAKAGGNATINITDLNCSRLSITARANALVNMQNVESQYVELTSQGNARITANVFDLADNYKYNATQLRAIATDNATIYVDSLAVGNAYLRAQNFSSITLHVGTVHNTLEMTYDIDNMAQINTGEVLAKQRIDSDMPEVGEIKELMGNLEASASGSRFHSYMLWGFHNWGEINNGMASVDGANTVRTTFNTFQLNFQWKLVKRAHCDLSVGIGFEWDRYKFSNNYVHLNTDGTQGYFETWDAATLAANDLPAADLDAWKSRLITRYVTMPLTYSIYFANNKIRATLGVVTGMSLDSKKTGMRYFYDDGNVDYKDRVDASEYLNPFKCDVLAMLKFGFLGLYVQVPTMPINRNMNVDLYPIKFGIVI